MSPGAAALLSALPAAAVFASFFLYIVLRPRRRQFDKDAVSRGGNRLLGLYLRDYWYWLHGPLERAALRSGLSPDGLTLIGTAVTVAAGAAFAARFFGLGGWLVVAGGALDILDGRVARARGLQRPAGAFLDSTLDRVGDWALFAGLAAAYRESAGMWLALLSLGAGFLISYARARGESLGVMCAEGWLQRAERFFFLAAAGILSPVFAWFGAGYGAAMLYSLAVLAVLTVVTAAMRMTAIYRTLASRSIAAS